MSAQRPSLRLLASAVTLVALAAIACGTTTQLSNVWRSESYSAGPMKKILVVGIAETTTGRRSFEDHFAGALAGHQVEGVASHELLPSDERLTEAVLKEAIRGHGFEGVIATRLIGVDEETTYVPPSTRTVPSAYGGHRFYGYYGRSWDVVHTPGYTVTKRIVRLETRLYDARDAELAWGAQSGTFESDSRDDMIESVTKKITKQLVSDGLLPR
jgi:hypothetical protein